MPAGKGTKFKVVWFLPRTRDSPPVGAMALGNIITSPHYPEEALNENQPPAIPAANLRRIEEDNWSWEKEFKRAKGGGVFASFLEWTGVGGELEGSSEDSQKEVYNVEKLVTESFVPSRDYLSCVMAEKAVDDAVKRSSSTKKVFIITGLKTAYNATKAIEAMEKNGFHAQIGVNLASTGVPITIGPKADLSREENEKGTQGKKDFIFGFQLRQIKYNKKVGEVSTVPYDKGALYGADGKDKEQPTEPDTEIEVEGLVEKELTAGDFGMDSIDIPGDTEDEMIEYIYPPE